MDKQQEPVVNKIKVEDTTSSYNTSTETHIKPSIEKDALNTKNVSKFLKNNHGKIALGAIGVGLAKSVIDGEDDDVTSSVGKGLKTGALAAGLSYGSEHFFKSETVQDLVKGKVLSDTEKLARDKKVQSSLLKGGGKAGKALKIGMYALGATTVLDLGQRAGDRLEADRMKHEQEQKLKEKARKQKQKNKKYSYGYLDQGEIVMELFDARSGHYKMGNAKFN